MIRDMVDADLRFVALVNPATPFLPHFRSVEVDGKVVAIFGYQTVCNGVGQTWVCVNPQSTRHPLAIIRAGKHLAQVAMKKFSLHRLQTAVLASDYRMCRMIGSFVPVAPGASATSGRTSGLPVSERRSF